MHVVSILFYKYGCGYTHSFGTRKQGDDDTPYYIGFKLNFMNRVITTSIPLKINIFQTQTDMKFLEYKSYLLFPLLWYLLLYYRVYIPNDA